MRVCFLADPNHPNTINWLEQLSGELGLEIHLISLRPVKHAYRSVEVHCLAGPTLGKLNRYLGSIGRVRATVREIAPDLLVGYRITSYGFVAAATGFHPLVLAAQGQNIAYNNSRVKKVFCRFAIRRADLIHSWGEHMTDKLVALGADRRKVLTLPRGIDTGLFRPNPAARDASDCAIVSTRGLNPDYNHEQILRALKILSERGFPFRFRSVGEGRHRSVLEALAHELALDSVHYVGRLGGSALAGELGGADIYVSAVPTDGVSASLLEAMACGCLPIVVDNRANRLWVRHGENGLLFRLGDHVDLAEKIMEGFARGAWRSEASLRNREIVLERGDIRNNLRTFVEAWRDLTAPPRRTPRREG